MIQPNICCGICHTLVWFARENNKLKRLLNDQTKFTSSILYVDSNNLYGWAKSQQLQDVEYDWVSYNDCSDAFPALEHKAFLDRWYDN